MRHYGAKGFWIKLTERFQKSDIDYKEWYENHKPSEQELEKQRARSFGYAPKISILVPVYNTRGLFETDDSVGEKADIYEMGVMYCQCQSKERRGKEDSGCSRWEGSEDKSGGCTGK